MTKKKNNKEKTFRMFRMVQLELQSHCNRDCWFCPRHLDRSGHRKDANGESIKKKFPTEKIRDIFEQLCELNFKKRIIFHHLSEPTLDSRLIDVAQTAKRLGMKPFTFTNGDVLKNDIELCKKADDVFYSMIVGLYDYKNKKELNQQKKFWKERLKKTQLSFSCHKKRRLKPGIDPSNLKINVEKDLAQAQQKPCFQPNRKLIIQYDGNVSLCCQDIEAQFNLGNVLEQSIKEIWWSEKHIEICSNLEKPNNRKLYDLCSRCSRVLGGGRCFK